MMKLPFREFDAFCARHREYSKSQLCQDLFVLYELESKRDGFFVEFGGHDGITFSNTYLLEKKYGWRGIVAEPGKRFRIALEQARSCIVDFRCVWKTTGESLEFNEVFPPNDALSTLAQFSGSDSSWQFRSAGVYYQVETVSLNDLLKQHDAPQNIDYISVDTEGSEYDILSVFDFDYFDVKIFPDECDSFFWELSGTMWKHAR